MNFANGTYEPGEKLSGDSGVYYEATPGLYWYSGFGCGTFFKNDGTMLWCSPREAKSEADRLGLEFKYVDSFISSSSFSVMG